MEPYRFYIQQLYYNGETYAKGDVIDTLTYCGAVCKEFSEAVMPESKSISTRDWPGEDGLEVYVPKLLKAKEFEVEAEFLIVGDESLDDDAATIDAHERRKKFIKFLYGRNEGSVGSRLAIYDEHSEIGYKDVVVKRIPASEESHRQSGGNQAIYSVKVTFTVYDPVTDVTPRFTSGTIAELGWA